MQVRRTAEERMIERREAVRERKEGSRIGGCFVSSAILKGKTLM